MNLFNLIKPVSVITFLGCQLLGSLTGNAQIDWSNYSTSYAGSDQQGGLPLIITAIPYNGKYFDIEAGETGGIPDSLLLQYDQKNGLSRLENIRHYCTYDSAEVYFFAPGIYPSNASGYEFRVLKNLSSEMVPWSGIQQFSEIQLNDFKKGFALLGGFKTSWGNSLVVELRKRNSRQILSTSVVKWQELQPGITEIYQATNTESLNRFLVKLKRSWDRNLQYKNEEAQPGTGEFEKNSSMGKEEKLLLESGSNSIIVELQNEIFKKEALEYRLIRNGTEWRPWQSNDFDNNFIWLNNLPPGGYVLEMRYAAQRHKTNRFQFSLKPAWHQTSWFKVVALLFMLTLIGFVLLLVRLRSQKSKAQRSAAEKEKIQLELKSIRSQLNPHFIFNALNSIQGLVNKNDIDGTHTYLAAFSSLLRSALKNNEKEMIPLALELKTLRTYLSLEQLRFHFNYSIKVDNNINADSIEIPVFLLQPLAENAVKHGISSLYDKGNILIVAAIADKDLIIVIGDNGKGFDPAIKTSGFGLKLTRQRIQLLNQTLVNMSVSLSVDSGGANDTQIKLTFKNWLH